MDVEVEIDRETAELIQMYRIDVVEAVREHLIRIRRGA
jgi:hypothetical protein